MRGCIHVRGPGEAERPLRLLSITQGNWGERIAQNIADHAPADWVVQTWAAPRLIPPIVDDPEDFLPSGPPQADLLLALGDVPGFAQLIPDIARLCGAQAVLAPIDRNSAMPPGLVSQVRAWLEEMDVDSLFPKPFCSLTETQCNRSPLVKTYDIPLIARFARHFGRPTFGITVEGDRIAQVRVVRDAACGCARHVSRGLAGERLEDAAERAGMLHHHYPCLASMDQDGDYNDTLMHVSGNFLKDAIQEEVSSYTTITYLRPHGRSDDEGG